MKLISNLSPIDRQASECFGIPSLSLMERAGEAIAEAVRRACPTDTGKPVYIVLVCGPGNNGGDGFVCARLLSENPRLQLTVLHTTAHYSGDAAVNFERLRAGGITRLDVSQGVSPEALQALKTADVIVDALFGSGLSRPIEGVGLELIGLMNQQRQENPALVIAVDLPSGLNAWNGQPWGAAVAADETVTFGASKPGLHLQPGKTLAGDVIVADIGLPPSLIEEDPSPVRLTEWADAYTTLPTRHPAGHKYTFGSVLVLAGSRNMPGAPALTTEAALRAGCGYVTLAAPQSVFQRASLLSEIVQAPLPEAGTGEVALSALSVLMQAIYEKKARTLIIGPGLGHTPETVLLLGQLLARLQQLDSPPVLVLDADALNALALLEDKAFRTQLVEVFPDREIPTLTLGPHVILTPHVGEAARLLRCSSASLNADLLKGARELQARTGAQVVLKSATTVVATNEGLLWINPTGNSGMATAGSGDVLSGLLAGLAAQGVSPPQVGPLAVYLHGLAGDMAAQTLTPYVMCASDITRHFAPAFKELMP